MTRYIARHESSTVGMDNILIREYVSDRNALRYMHKHLQAPHFAAGQYEVRTFPQSDYRPNKDGTYGRHVGYLYKRP